MCRAVPVAMSESSPLDRQLAASWNGSWLTIESSQATHPPLRCWLAQPQGGAPRGGVLVLPEVFGLNAWVRSVAGRLAAKGYVALAVPLFARTAPDLELDYDAAGLQEGRAHKERTTSAELLVDLAAAAARLRQFLPDPAAGLGCVGFCFGGHVAVLAATLPEVVATCDFYGAGVANGRLGGGPPTLELLPAIGGRLLCCCGDDDPLIPGSEVRTLERALEQVNRAHLAAGNTHPPHRLLRFAGAGHGFLCEARPDFRPQAAREAWSALFQFFADSL